MTSSPSLFLALDKWCSRAKENFLTEVIAAVFREYPALTCLVIGKIAGFDLDPNTLAVEAQARVDRWLIDLRITDRESCILVEVKLDAPLREDQLKNYSTVLETNYSQIKKRRLIALLRWVPSKPESSDQVVYLYLGELFSRLRNASGNDPQLVPNKYLLQEMFKFFEGKQMVAFEGFAEVGQIADSFAELHSFITQCRALKEQLQHRLKGFKEEESLLTEGDEELAGWYFEVTPEKWQGRGRDPSFWCGFYVEDLRSKGPSGKPIVTCMALWCGFYCKPNDKEDRERIESIMQDVSSSQPDDDDPEYLVSELYSVEISELIKGKKDPTEQTQVLEDEIRKKLEQLQSAAEKIYRVNRV